MRKAIIPLCVSLLMAALPVSADEGLHPFVLDAKKLGSPIQTTMYGIFFEDINFGADGGLYAEMVENRSFEFPQSLMGWNTFGKVSLSTDRPAFERNPHYVTIFDPGHREKRSGIDNHGFFGMGFKKDMKYFFSVYGRLHATNGKSTEIRVELIDENNEIIDKQTVTINSKDWKKYEVNLTSKKTVAKGGLRIFHQKGDGVDLDHVSLFPEDNWNGLRRDLVNDLKDLHPGIFRFPGGCIVEGTDIGTRYQWKHSVGQVENRPLNENRWNYTFPHRMYPNYYQTYGMGFYELFLLSEYIGAAPLPILNVGLACQYQNDDDSDAHIPVNKLDEYIQDALDLIEFANGDVTTKWGKLRADMGHPAPFNLKFLGIGNEQWGPLYPERLEKFITILRDRHPEIKIVGSSGPSPDGDKFDYGWEQMRRLKVDLVDEHYYCNQDWFMNNVTRYDNYSRKGPKVFAGEYACHIKEHAADFPEAKNVFDAAICEAALMTGFERNADIVHMATYAPLFAHVDGWQWRPDLIWMDNLTTVRTPNYYVQQMYACNRGTHILKLTEYKEPITGKDGLCASAVYDKDHNNYIIKIVNTSEADKPVEITLKGTKNLFKDGTVTTLHAASADAANTTKNKNVVVPKTAKVKASGNKVMLTVPARTFAVYRF